MIMKNLLYKEFNLAIHPAFLLMLLFGVLLLIPQWPFLIALMYLFFIAIPNIFTFCKVQNDVLFSVLLPIRKKDVVMARMMSIVLLELLQILVAAVFAVLHMKLYGPGNFLLDPNYAFFGLALVMYAVFNVFFFPMFYKTTYKIAIPVVAATIAAVLFAITAELAVQAVPFLKMLNGMDHTGVQLLTLVGGIIVFVLLNISAYAISAKRFEHVDL
jgi:ABC-2 type transport system permease protein